VSDQILTLDPRDGRIEAANVGQSNVSALTADSAGRVWFGDESRKRVGLYDRASGTVTDFAVPFAGTLTSMVVDATGTLWAGTDAGELFAIRNGGLVTTTYVGGAVASLTLDSHGAAWFLTRGSGGATLGQVAFSGAARSVPASVAGVWFDARGDAWLADSGSAGFFIAVAEGR
jgi:streptogramin lyase